MSGNGFSNGPWVTVNGSSRFTKIPSVSASVSVVPASVLDDSVEAVGRVKKNSLGSRLLSQELGTPPRGCAIAKVLVVAEGFLVVAVAFFVVTIKAPFFVVATGFLVVIATFFVVAVDFLVVVATRAATFFVVSDFLVVVVAAAFLVVAADFLVVVEGFLVVVAWRATLFKRPEDG